MREKATQRAAGEAGFTLIEALVVLAVVGLLSALAFPAVDRARTTILARAARAEQTRILLAARANAMRYDQPFVLEAKPRGAGIAVAPEKADAANAADRAGALAAADVPASAAITGIEITPRRIVFYPDGSSTGGAIRLTTADGATMTFVVDRELGSVSEAGKPRA
jgi:general secretion pathway protein H